MQDDPMLTRNPEIDISAEFLEEYLCNQEEITPELSTKSIRDELDRGRNEMEAIQALIRAERDCNFKSVCEKFHVIESDAVPAIVNASVAKKIKQGKGNWREIQKYSVSISKRKLEKWGAEKIAEDLYQWTLPYDSFLGYMSGVLK